MMHIIAEISAYYTTVLPQLLKRTDLSELFAFGRIRNNAIQLFYGKFETLL